jgi:hypothetical protein
MSRRGLAAVSSKSVAARDHASVDLYWLPLGAGNALPIGSGVGNC